MPGDPATTVQSTDFFALFQEPRRPWLDSELLKQKFLALSAIAHPDRVHGASGTERQEAARRFSELNAAYQCLRELKDRLRHLLTLETGMKPADIERIPPAMTDSFFEIGRLLKEVDVYVAGRQNVTSPVLKAQMFERGLDWTDKLQEMQAKLRAGTEELETELKMLNQAWETADQSGDRDQLPLTRLEEIYRMLGYFGRWSAQLQERIVKLAV